VRTCGWHYGRMTLARSLYSPGSGRPRAIAVPASGATKEAGRLVAQPFTHQHWRSCLADTNYESRRRRLYSTGPPS
jgi:hypothetical protein